MKRTFAMVSFAVGVGGTAIVAAPQQRPGEPTQAKGWVQNREAAERIPVSVREVGGDVVVRTQVTAMPALTLAPGTVVTTRAAVRPVGFPVTRHSDRREIGGSPARTGKRGLGDDRPDVPGQRRSAGAPEKNRRPQN